MQKNNVPGSILFALICLGSMLTLDACKKELDPVITVTTVTVTALTCGSTVFSTTALSGSAYTGGNGVAYAAGAAIPSTGVTGLNATLQAGTLASGAGNLMYSISGTPLGRVRPVLPSA